MSDTPRTDAQTRDVFDGDGELPEIGSKLAPGGFYVDADFARELERENAELVHALDVAHAQLVKVRRYLPSHGTFGEEGINAYDHAEQMSREVLMRSRNPDA